MEDGTLHFAESPKASHYPVNGLTKYFLLFTSHETMSSDVHSLPSKARSV